MWTEASQRPTTINSVEQLDQIINMGAGLINRTSLSPAMSEALNMYKSATSAMHSGDLYQAAQGYRQLLEQWPGFVAPRANLALCLHFMGDYDDALRQLEVAHEFAPDDPEIHVNAGRIYEALGDKGRELEQYHQALQDRPDHVEAMGNLGITYRETGQIQESMRWLLRAQQVIEQQEAMMGRLTGQHPFKTNILIALAETCEALGDWKQAGQFWKQARRTAPADAQLWAHIRQARKKNRLSWLPWRR
jgi:tetratricopeptide (TPR) repeat protein